MKKVAEYRSATNVHSGMTALILYFITVLVPTICESISMLITADYTGLYRIIPDYILLLIILYISKVYIRSEKDKKKWKKL